MRKLGWVLLSLLACVGCETVNSDDVDTEAVYANLVITADGSGSSLAYAALKTGGPNSNTYLDLSGGDTLIAYQGEDSSAMIRHELAGAVWYEANFPVDAEDTPFTISFLRVHTEESSCDGASAPESTATMPAPFDITAPTAGASFSRATDDITVTWDASGSNDNMVWLLSGSCVEARTGSISGDPGTLTILANDMVALDGQEGTTCDVTIDLERSRDGILDPNYGEGGRIRGRQLRSIEISSAP